MNSSPVHSTTLHKWEQIKFYFLVFYTLYFLRNKHNNNSNQKMPHERNIEENRVLIGNRVVSVRIDRQPAINWNFNWNECDHSQVDPNYERVFN